MEITRIAIFEVRRKPVQEFCDGRGKVELNRVRKSLSVVQCHAGLLPNDLDGISEMALCFPSMCRVVRGQVLLVFM